MRLSCAASGKVQLVSVHLCDSGHRASPTSSRLERGVTFGVGQRKERKLICPKPLRVLQITRRVVLGSGSCSMGKLRFAFSSVAEGRRCSACSTYVRCGSPCSQGVFTRLQTDARTSDLYNSLDYWVLACTCLLYTSPSPRDGLLSRMPSSA